MTAVRVTCPECDAVLKLAGSPPSGKKLKCPKCEAMFAPQAKEVTEDDPDQPVKTAARKPMAPQPKPKASVAKPAAEAKKGLDDDDDGPKTYGFGDEGPKVEVEKEEIDYGLDTSLKDLRGPAQAAVIKPSNFLMMCGAIGFISWLIVLTITIIIVFLPVRDDKEEKDGILPSGRPVGPTLEALVRNVDVSDPVLSDKEKEMLKEDERLAREAQYNLVMWAGMNVLWFIVILLFTGFGMFYAFLVMVGAVKVQNLESRGWGIASSILVMFPIHTFGLMMLTMLLMSVIFIGLLEDPGLAGMFILVLCPLEALLNVGVGAWMLTVLLSKVVITGFEYKPA